ncbi:MAG: fasciclin domain-containing protein [Bacteroidota bacterium]|nr:fasciclin domain-containing protein [Bacteroidota bacterium]
MKKIFDKLCKQYMLSVAAVVLLAACNKDVPEPTPVEKQTPATGVTIADLINTDPNFSLLKTAINRVPGLVQLLGDKDAQFTVFAPDDAAFQRSGINAATINALPVQQLGAIMQYHIVGGQRLTSAAITTAFPNVQLPTQLVLAPPSATLPPGLRMPLFPSKRGTASWINNIPLTAFDIAAANGVIHKVAAILAPPQQMLWERIVADDDLDYLEAAVLRADQATPSPGLQAALSNPAANFTVFAPNDAAFQQVLTGQITLALMNMGVPAAQAQAQATALASTPAVFTNPALATVLTPTTVQGLVVYHLLGARAFTVNLPATATATPTLLNRGIPNHPGVTIQATFGTTGVTAATVKGAANQTASNILINPTPAPGGTSDQHYVNGTLHVINQVLLPQ